MRRLEWITRPALGLTARLRRAAPIAHGSLVDLLYPPQCAWCKADLAAAADDISLCDDCRAELAPPVGNWCARCSAAISYAPEVGEDCIYCRGRQFRFDRALALGN